MPEGKGQVSDTTTTGPKVREALDCLLEALERVSVGGEIGDVEDFDSARQDAAAALAGQGGGHLCGTCSDKGVVQAPENPVVGMPCPDCSVKNPAALAEQDHPALSRDDGKRLRAIAGYLESACAERAIHPDFADRDVRFLRDLVKHLGDGGLREAARQLADVAAAATCEPRKFHENVDERQQALGQAAAAVRNLLRASQLGEGDR
jgi:hypothetical protein